MYKKFFRRFLPFVLSVAMTVEMIPVTAFAAEVPTVIEAEETDDAEAVDVEAAETGTAADEESGAAIVVAEETDAEAANAVEASAEEANAEEVVAVEEVAEEEVGTDLGTFDAGEKLTEIRVGGVAQEDLDPQKVTYESDKENPLSFVTELTYWVYVNGKTVDVDLSPQFTRKWQRLDAESGWVDMAGDAVPKDAGKYQYVVSMKDVAGFNEASVAVPCEITKRTLKVEYKTYRRSYGPDPANGNKYGPLYKVHQPYDTNGDGVIDKNDAYEYVTDELGNKIPVYETVEINADGITVPPGSTKKDLADKLADCLYVTDGGNEIDKKLFFESITTPIKDAAGNVITDDNTVLKASNDYYYSVELKLKELYAKNYEVDDADDDNYALADRKVNVADLIETKVGITDQNGNEIPAFTKIESLAGGSTSPAIEVDYSGQKITVADIKAKILTKVYAKDQDGEWAEVTDDDNAKSDALQLEWWDSNGDYKLDEDPTNSGLYALRLVYNPGSSKDGIYARGVAFIHVRIKAISVTIVPKPAQGAAFYAGMNKREVLNQIDYSVMLNSGSEYTIDKNTFWGVSYKNVLDYDKIGNTELVGGDEGQAFAPLFRLEYAEKDKDGNWIKEGDEVVYKDIDDEDNDNKLLDPERQYRVVFTGMKVAYDASGDEADRCSINEKSVNSADNNYDVNIDASVLKAKYVAIELSKSTKTEVDVTAILKDGKGTSFKEPVVQIVNETGIYSDRASYKKASIKNAEEATKPEVAKDTDKRISYVWQRFDEGKSKYDADGNFEPYYGDIVTEGDMYEYGIDNQKAPQKVGKYRLHITFIDPDHKYAWSEGYVYYEVQSQYVSVVPTGKFPAYTGMTVKDFIDSYDFDASTSIYKIEGNDYASGDYKTKIAAGEYELNKLELEKKFYYIKWHVERSVKNDDGTDVLDEAGNLTYEEFTGKFINDKYKYRLMPEFVWDGEAGKYTDHIKEYGEKDRVNEVCFNIPLDIELAEMGSIKVDLHINADLLTTYKVYDGLPIETSAEKVPGLITVTNHNDGTEIADFPIGDIQIRWDAVYEVEEYGYLQKYTRTDLTEAVNAGHYTMRVFFPGNDKYYWTKDKNGQWIGWSTDSNGNVQTGTYNEAAGTVVQNAVYIAKRTLTIQPVISKQVKAGEIINGNWSSDPEFDIAKYIIKGAEGTPDEDAFKYGFTVTKDDVEEEYKDGILAFGYVDEDGYHYNYKYGLRASIYGKKDDLCKDGYKYKSDVEYYGKTAIDASRMSADYRYNYKVTNLESEVYTAERVGSQVVKVYNNLRDEYDAKAGTHKVAPCEGLNFYTVSNITSYPIKDYFTGEYLGADDDHRNGKEGNYFIFEIQAPEEFGEYDDNDDWVYPNLLDDVSKKDKNGRAIYKNSIENAGGTVVNVDSTNGYIRVAFPVDAKSENVNFDIQWRAGYLEKFEVVLKGAILKADTSKAQLPKSMKFNAVSKKVVVGEVQQLDVKVTKKQVSDNVLIGYSVSNSEILSVTPNGAVTGLKKGSATVSAFPIRIVDGKVEKLGGKTISTKITVVDVAKPAIKKATAVGTKVTVTYKKLANGYRREFYIMEGKKNAAAFEANIKKSVNNEWKGLFATAPEYGDGDDIPSGSSILTKVIYGSDLDYNKQYTIYVRNVSGIRTLSDGSVVTLSAQGVVKTFKTTKANITRLDIDLDEKYEITAEKGHITTDDPEDYDDHAYGAVGKKSCYAVPIDEKSVQAFVYGAYKEYHENDAAEKYDLIWKKLPLGGADKKIYADPKITYYALDLDDYKGDYIEKDASKAKLKGYTVKIRVGNMDRYYKPSSIADIDKKNGKVTLKGLGHFYLVAFDQTTGEMDYHCVHVTGQVDSFTGKDTKVKVGQTINIYDQLEYKVGTQTVIGDPNDFAAPSTVAYDVPGYYVDKNGLFYAKKAGTYPIEVEDTKVGAKTTVTVTAAGLDPVKSLKKVYVYANNAKIKFTYTKPYKYNGVKIEDGAWLNRFGYNDGDLVDGIDFRVDIWDARGNLIQSNIIDSQTYIKTAKKDTWEYTYEISSGLSRKSSYKLSVTAFYGDEESKAATLKIKTTDYPASKWNLDDVWEWQKDPDTGNYVYVRVKNAETGNYRLREDDSYYYPVGEKIIAQNTTQNTNANDYTGALNDVRPTNDLHQYPYVMSGNTYVLHIGVSNDYAKYGMTDKLTWKSKNSKVASVKVVPGTYTAKLTAKKPGFTVIEVKSGITKKVISRQKVYVKAVGDGRGFQGTYDDKNVWWDAYYEKNVETLSVKNPFSIKQGSHEYVWVCYDVKEEGFHDFSYGGRGKIYEVRIMDGTAYGKTISYGSLGNIYLYEGMKLYFRAEGEIDDLNVTCTPTVKMPDNNKIQITGKTAFTYTAPADGLYVFSSKNKKFFSKIESIYKSYEETLDSYSVPETDEKDSKEVQVRMNKGDTVMLTVRGSSEAYEITVAERKFEGLEVREDNPLDLVKDVDKWYRFTAKESGEYSFKTTDASEMLEGSYYSPFNTTDVNSSMISNLLGKDANNLTKGSIKLEAGDSVAFRISTKANAATITGKISISVNAYEKLELDKAVPIKISGESGDEATKWARFLAPYAGVFTIDVSTKSDTGYTASYSIYGSNSGSGSKDPDNETITNIISNKRLEKGDVVYVVLTSKTEGVKDISLTAREITDRALKNGEAVEKTMSNNQSYWYSFTAPEYGYYDFRVSRTINKVDGNEEPLKTHDIDFQLYKELGNDIVTGAGSSFKVDGSEKEDYIRRVMDVGEKITFRVESKDNVLDASGKVDVAATTNVSVKVARCEFEKAKITGGEQSVSLEEKTPVAYYQYVATEAGTYEFYAEDVSESINYSYSCYKENDIIGYDDEEDPIYGPVKLYKQWKSVSKDKLNKTKVELKKGDGIYFIATMSSGTSATGKLYVKTLNAEVTGGETSKISIDGNKAKWFSYYVEKTARYYISVSDPSCKVELYDEMDITGAGEEVKATGKIYKTGQTIFIKVTNKRDTEVSDIKLEVKRIEPKALTLKTEEPIVAKDKDLTWYYYTATEPGLYKIDYTVTDKGSADRVYCDYYYPATDTGSKIATLGWGYTVNDPASIIIFMDKGDSYDFNVMLEDASDETTESKATLKVAKVEVESKNVLVKEPISVEVKSNTEPTWCSYEATEDGLYTFSKGDSKENISATFYVNKASMNSPRKYDRYILEYLWSKNLGTINSSIDLKKGDKVLMEVSSGNPEKITFNLSVSMQDVITLVAGTTTKDIKMASDTSKALRIKTYKNDKYIIRTENISVANANVHVNIPGSWYYNGNGFTAIMDLNVSNNPLGHGPYELSVNPTSEDVKEVSFDIVVEKAITDDSLIEKLDTKKEVKLAKDGGVKVLQFTAPETATYELKMDETTKSVDAPTGKFVATKGEVRTFNVVNYEASEDVTLNFTISKVEADKALNDKATSVELSNIKEGTTEPTVTWCSYTANKSGKYQFGYADDPADPKPSNIYISVYSQPYEGMGSIGSWNSTTEMYEVTMAKDDTVYLRLTNYNPETDEKKTTKCTVTSERLETSYDSLTEDAEIRVGSTYSTFGSDELKYVYVKFKVPSTGWYSFKSANYNYAISYYESGSYVYPGSSNGNYYEFDRFLPAGKTILLRNASELSEYSTFTLEVKAVEDRKVLNLTAEGIKYIYENTYYDYSISRRYGYYKYTAPETGKYKFTCTGNSGSYSCNLYDANLISMSYQFNEEISLTEGETVYLRVYGDGYKVAVVNLGKK